MGGWWVGGWVLIDGWVSCRWVWDWWVCGFGGMCGGWVFVWEVYVEEENYGEERRVVGGEWSNMVEEE